MHLSKYWYLFNVGIIIDTFGINLTKELRKQLATVENDVEKLAILNRIKQIQQQVEQKAKASKSI